MGASLCCFQSDADRGSLTKPRTLSAESTSSDECVPVASLPRINEVQHISHMTCVQTTTYHTTFSRSSKGKNSRSSPVPIRYQYSSHMSSGLGTILEEPNVRPRTYSSESSFGNYGSMKSYKRFVTKK